MKRGRTAGWERYSERFQDPEQVDQYVKLYQPGTLDAVIWSMQREYLASLIRETAEHSVGLNTALDYACGTGRLTELLVECGLEVVAADVSEAMIAVAQERCPEASYVVGDISCPSTTSILHTGRKFGLITAFRLFLNLDDSMRLPILSKLGDLLEDEGLLLVNNHGSGPSLRSFTLWVRRREGPNSISHRRFESMLHDAGLRVEGRVGGVIFTPKFHKLPIIGKTFFSIEKCVYRRPFGRRIGRALGTDQIYFCRPVGSAGNGPSAASSLERP
jgi:SAM-dependent methyltransferase